MKALIVIDVQKGIFEEPDNPVWNADQVLANINSLIRKARSAEVRVIFVQHDAGSPPFTPGYDDFRIHASLDVQADDPVFVKKELDSFLKTGLDAYLRGHGIDELTLCGLQSQFCVDTACRRAYSLGYKSTIVSDAHSTLDSEILPAEKIVAHHNSIWGGRFGILKTTAETEFI